jgi:hypothetical protein
MLATNQHFVYAMFKDEAAAAEGARRLIESEFPTEHIGALILDDSQNVKELQLRHKTGIGPGAALGAVLGATAGMVALPAMGLVAIGGAFAFVEAAVAGGATGLLAGTLGGLGLWKDELEVPREAFERGGVLVGTLTGPERAEAARAALAAAGGEKPQIETRARAEQVLRETGKHPHMP